jgi:hypothetical protein
MESNTEKPQDSVTPVSEEQRQQIEKTMKEKQKVASSKVTRCQNELLLEMADFNNLHTVKTLVSKYDELVKSYVDIVNQHLEIIIQDDVSEKEEKRHQEKLQCITDFKKSMGEFIKNAEQKLHEELDSASGVSKTTSSTSKTTKSSSSSKKTCRSASSKEKIKMAQLHAEKELLKQKHLLNLQKEQLELDIKIAKSKAAHDIC